MPTFRTEHAVAHAPDEMFALVADVERYPDFLPFCEALEVKRRTGPDGAGLETIVADMRVGYKAINERFTTRVRLDRGNSRILVEHLDGPFTHLENRWTFRPDPRGCLVEFWIDYEFRSRLLAAVAGAVFDRIFRSYTGAFEARADALYGGAKTAARA